MEVVEAPEREVPPALRAQVLALHELAWPTAEDHPSPVGHDPALSPLSMLLVDGDQVLAALDILAKAIEHAGQAYRACGLSTVVTDPSRRREGHGQRLVVAARARMEASGADLAIFTCDAPLAPFYERAGFVSLPGAQLIGGTPEDPWPSGPLGKVTLASLFTARAKDHRADFEGADIVLHPGPHDRLW